MLLVAQLAAVVAATSEFVFMNLDSQLPQVVADYLVTVALTQSKKLRGTIVVSSAPSTNPPGILHAATYIIYKPFPNSDSGICATDADIPCFTLFYQTATFLESPVMPAPADSSSASSSAASDGAAAGTAGGQDQEQQQAPPRVMLEERSGAMQRVQDSAPAAAFGHRKLGRILVADIAFAVAADRASATASAISRCYWLANKLICTTS
ncbi:hypothetical protein CLOP_g10334 [Closterium sp. NIES-67]|nr:hypothetical protein CLOP_g10334 [Closterium sp. NIES-67]